MSNKMKRPYGNYEADNLLEEIKRFLENHGFSELMEIVRVANYPDIRKSRNVKRFFKHRA